MKTLPALALIFLLAVLLVALSGCATDQATSASNNAVSNNTFALSVSLSLLPH